MKAVAPRVMVIEGRRVLVVERPPPLPRTLDALLAAMSVTFRAPVRITGWRRQCDEQDHRFFPWIDGRHTGTDGVDRRLRLLMCVDCEAVCVRDVSFDYLSSVPVGGRGPARRDHVIAWYSGARMRGREYR